MIGIRLRLRGFGGGQNHRGEESLSLPSPATVATLLDHLENAPVTLSSAGSASHLSLDSLLVAVNGRLIQHRQGLDTPLAEGDLVTLMPPVVGG